ncbi:MAG: MMPL family transporter [Thermoplasmata archaeon]
MFEKLFHGLGRFTERRGKYIIAVWIILALIFLPFTGLIFQETSYDIAGSVVTSNSMSGKASSILSQEFGSSNNSSSSLDFILIENSSVNSRVVTESVISMQNEILNNTILKRYNVSIDSIYTVERSLLLNFSTSAKGMLSGIYTLNNETRETVIKIYSFVNYSKLYMDAIVRLANETHLNYLMLFNNTRNALLIIYGIPEFYKNVFIYSVEKGMGIQLAELIAYRETINFINSYFSAAGKMPLEYFNNFTYFWNYTITSPSMADPVEYYSIYMTVHNSSFSTMYSGYFIEFWQLLVQNFNEMNYMNDSAIKNFAVDQISSGISSNYSLVQLLPFGVHYFVYTVTGNVNYSSLAIDYASVYFRDLNMSSILGNSYLSDIFRTNDTLNYTVTHISYFYSRNSTIMKFLKDIDVDPLNFVRNAYYSVNLTETSILYASDVLERNFYGNPLTLLNNATLNSYLYRLNNSDVGKLVNSTLLEYNFTTYPVIPSDYIYHKFVSYVGNVSIILINLDRNAPLSTLDIINSTARHYIGKLGPYLIGGEKAIEGQLTDQTNSGMMRALAIGVIAAIAISIAFFRSPVSGLLPILMFGISSDISLGLNAFLYKYILHSQVTFITPTLLLILLLGLTTDYSVYMLSRFRNELKRGNGEAALNTVEWAGHAVFTSGLTVILSYVLLWLTNVPLFSDSGLTNAISITTTLILALTFLPSLMFILGRRIFWPGRIESTGKVSHRIMESVFNFDRKYRKALLVIFIILTLGSLYIYEITPSGMDVFQLVPHESGLNAVEIINKTFRGDSVFQNYVILVFPSPVISNGTYNMNEMNVVTGVEDYLLSTGKISFVYGPTYPFGKYISPDSLDIYNNITRNIYISQINTYIGKDNRTVVIYFQTSMLSWTNGAMDLVNKISSSMGRIVNSSVTWYIGGLAQGLIDANQRTLTAFQSIVPILSVAAFFVLVVQLNSLFTPLRLVLMVIGIVIFSLVIGYLIFYYTFHMPILIFMPMFVFITLLAVGLDYDIFMITRVREEVMKGRDDEEGIRTSLYENGSVIVILGTILIATFLSLYFTSIAIIQEVGVGLALGVLADTLISWMIFIPSVMLIMKKYNWWPSRIGKK